MSRKNYIINIIIKNILYIYVNIIKCKYRPYKILNVYDT